jgi:hypothetical protein
MDVCSTGSSLGTEQLRDRGSTEQTPHSPEKDVVAEFFASMRVFR